MRCMDCGEEMALTKAVPNDAITAPGFEHRTFACLGCHSTETRHVFAARREVAPAPAFVVAHRAAASAATTVAAAPNMAATASPNNIAATAAPKAAAAETMPASCVSALQEPAPSNGVPRTIIPAGAWVRAVEKLRGRQADLMQRAPWPEREHWIVQFRKDWEKLAPPRRRPSDGPLASGRPSDISYNSSKAVRRRLRKLTSDAGSNRPGLPVANEAVQKFNRFWDSLVPSQTQAQEAPEQAETAAAALAHLPRSLSLVPVGSLQAGPNG